MHLVPKGFTRRFYELVLNRDFTEAERVLNGIKGKASNANWSRGFILALEGILSAYRNKDDKYAFLNRLQPDADIAYLQKLREEFGERAKSLISTEFDRGFFYAWSDFIQHYISNSANVVKAMKPT